MQVWCDWQLTLCDPHLSALEVRFHDDALYKSMFTFTFTYVGDELAVVVVWESGDGDGDLLRHFHHPLDGAELPQAAHTAALHVLSDVQASGHQEVRPVRLRASLLCRLSVAMWRYTCLRHASCSVATFLLHVNTLVRWKPGRFGMLKVVVDKSGIWKDDNDHTDKLCILADSREKCNVTFIFTLMCFACECSTGFYLCQVVSGSVFILSVCLFVCHSVNKISQKLLQKLWINIHEISETGNSQLDFMLICIGLGCRHIGTCTCGV